MTLKRCTMESVVVRGPHLIVSGTIQLRLVSMPPILRRIWDRAVAQAGLRCQPTLFTVESIEGAGGVYIPGSVVVGLEDLRDLADRLIAAGSLRVLSDAETRWWQRHDPSQLITPEDRFQAAAEHLIHHELGHAVADQWRRALKGPAEEAQADAIAGRIAARLGVRPDLGQAFFRAVGCHAAPHCSHPSPSDRVRAFDQGYQAELERQAASAW